MGKTIDFNRARLLALARPMRACTLEAAHGRCLVLSLYLAERAQATLGVELELVRWRVRGDPHFRDHWAVWVNEQTVIDLTRVQVDGQTQLAGPAGAYPQNYVDMRRYPARLLLIDLHSEVHARPSGVLPCMHLRGFARRILMHDLRVAWAQRRFMAGWSAVRAWHQFNLWLTLREIRRSLQKRAQRLTQRLQALPDYSTCEAGLYNADTDAVTKARDSIAR
jgi:hypothetical protein